MLFPTEYRLKKSAQVIRWPILKENYEAELAEVVEIFGGEVATQRLAHLQQRVVEHNILVIRKYYRRVTLVRLGELLDLDLATAEKHISDMVVKKVRILHVVPVVPVVDFVDVVSVVAVVAVITIVTIVTVVNVVPVVYVVPVVDFVPLAPVVDVVPVVASYVGASPLAYFDCYACPRSLSRQHGR
jgi:hypothetical protein